MTKDEIRAALRADGPGLHRSAAVLGAAGAAFIVSGSVQGCTIGAFFLTAAVAGELAYWITWLGSRGET